MAPAEGASLLENQLETENLEQNIGEVSGSSNVKKVRTGKHRSAAIINGRDVGHTGSYKLPVVAAFLGAGLLLAGVLFAVLLPRNSGGASQSVPLSDSAVELVIQSREEVDDPCKTTKCTGPNFSLSSDDKNSTSDDKESANKTCAQPGYDCSKSKCCAWSGMQCYKKSDHWASCKISCVPGPDLTDPNPHHWSCEKLGERAKGDAKIMKPKLAKWVDTTCSKPGQDCSKTKCCAWAGMQCYTKSEHWATCRPSCIPGPDPTDMNSHPWNCTALGPRTPGTSTVKFEAMKPAKWVADKCSKPGENCNNTKCCAHEGMQCYEKNDHHAGCKVSCEPGPDLTDTNPHPWTCKEIGFRTPGISKPPTQSKVSEWVHSTCAKPGQNCADTKCCAYEGMQCFKKNDNWASCRYFCDGGPDPTDVNNHPWNCTALGPRSPGKINWNTEGKPAAWVADSCAKPGQDCSKNKCCVAEGEQCFQKDGGWAMCKPSCNAGPNPRDSNPIPWSCKPLGFRTPGMIKTPSTNIPVPAWVSSHCSKSGQSCQKTQCCAGHGEQCYAKDDYWAVCMTFCTAGKDANGEDWSCKEVGSRTPKPWGSPSLYCFSVLRNTGYEPGLMEAQFDRAAGIFACDGYDLACSEPLTLKGVIKAIHFQGAAVGTSKDNTAANTQLFMNVWDSIKARGLYAKFDWTVKADPDAVIVPDRLRNHLKPYTGGKAYIVNCDKPTMTPMMFGSLETFTKQAMDAYFNGGAQKCKTQLQWGQWGEDYYMGKCMDMLGVTKTNDFSIISDGVCKQVNCFDQMAAAFHPFKSTGAWLNCYANTQR